MTSPNGTPEQPRRGALFPRIGRQSVPPGWGFAAGLLALAVAFGLGRASKGPEPAAVPVTSEPELSPVPRSALERDLGPAPLQTPAVFLANPTAVDLPEPGSHEVLCIRKPGRSARKSIEQLGGRRRDGAPWRLAREQAIEGIKANRWSFHVGSGDAASDVLVDVSRSGKENLKTRPDGRADNNLLSLPECP
jgi:Protein of unknown function (DUF3892)